MQENSNKRKSPSLEYEQEQISKEFNAIMSTDQDDRDFETRLKDHLVSGDQQEERILNPAKRKQSIDKKDMNINLEETEDNSNSQLDFSLIVRNSTREAISTIFYPRWFMLKDKRYLTERVNSINGQPISVNMEEVIQMENMNKNNQRTNYMLDPFYYYHLGLTAEVLGISYNTFVNHTKMKRKEIDAYVKSLKTYFRSDCSREDFDVFMIPEVEPTSKKDKTPDKIIPIFMLPFLFQLPFISMDNDWVYKIETIEEDLLCYYSATKSPLHEKIYYQLKYNKQMILRKMEMDFRVSVLNEEKRAKNILQLIEKTRKSQHDINNLARTMLTLVEDNKKLKFEVSILMSKSKKKGE